MEIKVKKDNTAKISREIQEAILNGLEEACGELESTVIQATKVDTGKTKGDWTHEINESEMYGLVGSNNENAIWEEFGTGEFAVGDKKGRTPYWVFVKNGEKTTRHSNKQYTLEEAKQMMAILRSKGLEAYYTKGKRARHTLEKSYEARKNSIERIMADAVNSKIK